MSKFQTKCIASNGKLFFLTQGLETRQKNSLLEVLETKCWSESESGFGKKSNAGVEKTIQWINQNLIFFLLLVSYNMGVVKGRSKIIIAHVICHAQNVYNYLENAVCHLSWIPKSASFSPIFLFDRSVRRAPSPRVSKFCVNPNESTAISVPGLIIELKAHVMCGICGIHVNSCGKNHGTGIKSNMLQECTGVSDVAQNYTTQTGFRVVSSKKYFVPSIQL